MRSLLVLSLLLAALATALLGDHALAGRLCCSHCGCEDQCEKVCRLVKEEKKIDVICWGCKCEDFCLPKPSSRCCEHCEMVCAEDGKPCDPESPCVKEKKFVWTEWIPGCGATMHTKKKLMKKVITKKVPSYKWVVEDLCKQCETKAVVVAPEPDAAIPLPPAVEAKMLFGQNAAVGSLAD
jgi:hypothetical protein